jgi:cytochrome c oxidase subunit 2
MNAAVMPVFQPFSPEAADIAHLFVIVLVICAVILAVVIGMIGYGLIFFRHKPGAADPPPHFGNRKLEITWTVIPILIVISLFVLTARGMHESDPPATREPDLIVTAHQWWWEIHYPHTAAVTANEIHMPVGSQWLVCLQSADVIHDFWVPELARKIDVVPGLTNYLWLQASEPGNYAGTCAEFCGAEHAWMRFSVIAQSPVDYDAWLKTQEETAVSPDTDTAEAGLKLFQTMTCINCHSIRGVSEAGRAAPDLTHLAGRKFVAGGILVNTETNLFRWLKNPQAIKPGCLMPNLKLTDAQAGELADYLEHLK